MSSQSFNATVYSGITSSADKTGISPLFPLRDGSDFTTLLKRRSMYRENKSGSPFSGSPSPLYPVVQSNVNKLVYTFGHTQCIGCNGGAFHGAPLGS